MASCASVASFAACSSDESSPEISPDSGAPTDPPASSSIGTGGGKVITVSGAGVTIPASALGATTTITVTAAASAPLPANTIAVTTPYTFGPEGTTFAVPATVTLPFNASLVPSGKSAADIVIYTAPVGTTTYTPLSTKVVDAAHVSAQTSHFSTFVGAVADTPSSAPSDGGAMDGDASITAMIDASADATPDAYSDAMTEDGSSSDGGTADAAQPVALATNLDNPSQILVAGSNVYWMNDDYDVISAVPIAGGASTVVVDQTSGGDNFLGGMTTDGVRLIYEQNSSEIWSIPLVGGSPSAISTTACGLGQGIVADGSEVFWLTESCSDDTSDGNIFGAPISPTGTTTRIATGIGSPSVFAVDPSSFYWSTLATPYTIMTMPRAGGAMVTLATDTADIYGILVSGSNLYWADRNSISTVPVAGGTSTTLFSGRQILSYYDNGIAIDNGFIYWAETAADGSDLDEEIVRMPLGGGTPETIVAGQQAVRGIVFDATSMYWTSNLSTIWKLAK